MYKYLSLLIFMQFCYFVFVNRLLEIWKNRRDGSSVYNNRNPPYLSDFRPGDLDEGGCISSSEKHFNIKSLKLSIVFNEKIQSFYYALLIAF